MPNSCRVMRRPNRYFNEGKSSSVVGMVMERGAAVRRVADDGMPEPGRIRRRLRVNWRERRRHVVDSLLGRTEELELGSAGTGIMALLGVVLIVAAVPLVGTDATHLRANWNRRRRRPEGGTPPLTLEPGPPGIGTRLLPRPRIVGVTVELSFAWVRGDSGMPPPPQAPHPVRTTGGWLFAVCQKHMAKAFLHTAKPLPCGAHGTRHTTNRRR